MSTLYGVPQSHIISKDHLSIIDAEKTPKHTIIADSSRDWGVSSMPREQDKPGM